MGPPWGRWTECSAAGLAGRSRGARRRGRGVGYKPTSGSAGRLARALAMIRSTCSRSAPRSQARWTGEGAAATGELLAELDALHQVGTGVEMEDRHQPLVDRHRLGEAPGPGQAEDGLAFLREHVGHSRDPALGTHRHAFRTTSSRPAKRMTLAHLVAYVDEAAGVAGAVLEANDVLAVGQGNQDVRGDVVPVDRRVVVDHHRQVGAAGHAAEMLGGLVRRRNRPAPASP